MRDAWNSRDGAQGCARLLAGELAGSRSISDIDLLVAPRDAEALHALLRRELGFAVEGAAYPHHLSGLTRAGSLGIELHHRLAPLALPLDEEIWNATRHAPGIEAVELPSPTNLLLHTLEHAVRVNWTARYRLRDVLDVAALDTTAVDAGRVAAYLGASDCRGPMRILLGAAQAVTSPATPRADHAWKTVRRVGRTRIALAAWPRAPRVAERFFRYGGVVAEGSPRTIGRAGFDLARRLATRATDRARTRLHTRGLRATDCSATFGHRAVHLRVGGGWCVVAQSIQRRRSDAAFHAGLQ